MNHWRVGYGSDTEGPEQFEVTQATTTTKERARQNLMLRIPQFQAIAKRRSMHPGTWAVLNNNQKAALTSLVYNYGHLPRSVPVDPAAPEATAAAIRALQTHNGGINRKRRIKEAAVYLSPVTGLPKPGVGTGVAKTGAVAGSLVAGGSTVGVVHWTCGPCLWAGGLAIAFAIIAGIYLFIHRTKKAAPEIAVQARPVPSTAERLKALLGNQVELQKEIDSTRQELRLEVEEANTLLTTQTG